MRATDIIARKRDGGVLTAAEIEWFVQAYTGGEVPDYQASALLMAVYLRGMDPAETAALTGAMAASGRQLDLQTLLPGRSTLDKHSTGGVGDKTTLVVVPLLAAAGVAVCKMSGRGLGHTGGTLDKLEAIPNFRVDLTPEEMVAQVGEVGACLAGQTGDLAPADKKLYALRDATATVGSLPLIVGSILSKKLAGGAARFLFDVKVGSGALMKDLDDARDLGRALVEGARQHGRPAVAVLSDMSQPLGRTVGNALEVAEAVATLTPDALPEQVDVRFRELCLFLTVEGLLLAGSAPDRETARKQVEELLDGGAGLEAFKKIVAAQGGDVSVIDDPARLPKAAVVRPVTASQGGFVHSIDAEAIGAAVVALGGGRARKEDAIDPAVGIVIRAAVGDRVNAGEPLVQVHAASEDAARAAGERVRAAYTVSPDAAPTPPLIWETFTSDTSIL
jgi:pyrimidine-nucleoside phosphorylase